MEGDPEYKKGQKVLVTDCHFGHGVGEKQFLCVCEFKGKEIVLGEKLSGSNVYPIKGSIKLILPSEFKGPDKKA